MASVRGTRPAARAEGIADHNVDAALRLLDVAEASIDDLGSYPYQCEEVGFERPELRGVRRLVLPAPFDHYLVFYRPIEEQRIVDVIRVLHGAMDVPQVLLERGV